MPHIQQSTINNTINSIGFWQKNAGLGCLRLEMTLKRGQGRPSVLSPKRRLVRYGSQSSPLVHALPPAEHYAEEQDERHRARGLVVSLNGRLEKMRDAAEIRARAQQMCCNNQWGE